jgi:cytochrome c oxidase cbb3-type subunit 3
MAGGRCLSVVAAVAMALLAGCDSPPGRPSPQERPRRPSQVTDFDSLYGVSCAGCHGAAGRSGPARPLDDALYLTLVDDATLTRIIARGVPGSLHPAFARGAGGDLTDEQVAAVVKGMRERWGRPGAFRNVSLPPYAAGPTGDAARGARLFTARCSPCHGPQGRGGAKAGSVVDPAYLDLVTDQALRTVVICGRVDLGMPSYREGGEQPLSPEEISDLVAWMASHRPPPGLAREGERP